jgi:hypothetical protein
MNQQGWELRTKWYSAAEPQAKFQIQNSRPEFAEKFGRKTTNYGLVLQFDVEAALSVKPPTHWSVHWRINPRLQNQTVLVPLRIRN